MRSVRKELGMTLRQVSRALDLSAAYISMIERGLADHPPTADRIEQIADMLGEDTDEMCVLAGRVPQDIMARLVSTEDARLFKRIRAIK